MSDASFYPSLTRISPLASGDWDAEPVPRDRWATGDYVLCEAEPGGFDQLELASGRMVSIASGDHFVGVLGERQATLEATGRWQDVGEDGWFDLLTSAGLVGRLESKAPYLPSLMRGRYLGHVMHAGAKATMLRYVKAVPPRDFDTPTILMIGSSMSAGKTTAGKAVVRGLKRRGLTVLSAKLAGAGRFRDVLHMADAGADTIVDFVDAGLPSTVCTEDVYRHALHHLLSLMAGAEADAAVVEIGASPLAAYNGMIAIEAVRPALRATILAASDVYAVIGVRELVKLPIDLVCGPTANTRAGIRLVDQHCGIPALNLADPGADPDVDAFLDRVLAD